MDKCTKSSSRVQLCSTPWSVAHQALLSMEFSRKEYWSRLPYPTLGDLPNPGVEPESLTSPASQVGSLPLVPPSTVVVQSLSHVWLCDPINCSTPGFPVLRHLPELAQMHVHESVVPSNHLVLCCPPLLLPSIFPSIRVFSMSCLFTSGDQNTGASASASALPMSIQAWFPLRLSGLISMLSKGLSGVFSSTTVWKYQLFGAQPYLWSNSHIHTWLLGKP